MKRLLLPMLTALVLGAATAPAAAQPTVAQPAAPAKGVVWEAPPEYVQAARELRRIRAAGVDAVRTTVLRDERLLALADSLGLALYQDLPVAYLPAPALYDTLDAAARMLEAALERARGHPSARHFGLTSYSDTSTPAACAYVEALADRVRRHGPPGSRSYYLTPFARADPCAGAVDLVLLDALNRARPEALLDRWRAAHPDASARVGLGALGTWIDPQAARGRRVPHSAEAQARYLETHLSTLLYVFSAFGSSMRPLSPGGRGPGRGGTGVIGPLSLSLSHQGREDVLSADSLNRYALLSAASPAVVFVYRWRDLAEGAEDTATAPGMPGRRYGLRAADGTARPALRVVEGLYTGRQRVFVFPAGTRPGARWPWMALACWAMVAALGVSYAGSLRFRRMTQRYFRARGFYRRAVQEGRDVLTGMGVGLVALLGLGTGVMAGGLVYAVRQTGLLAGLHRLPPTLREPVAAALAQPIVIALTAGALYAAGLLLWAVALTVASRRGRALAPEQVLVLIAWPRWPVLVLMIAAAVAATLSGPAASTAALATAAAWLAVEAMATGRTLLDYTALTRLPPYAAFALALASPGALLLLAMLIGGLEFGDEVIWLWHLATRS